MENHLNFVSALLQCTLRYQIGSLAEVSSSSREDVILAIHMLDNRRFCLEDILFVYTWMAMRKVEHQSDSQYWKTFVGLEFGYTGMGISSWESQLT